MSRPGRFFLEAGLESPSSRGLRFLYGAKGTLVLPGEQVSRGVSPTGFKVSGLTIGLELAEFAAPTVVPRV